MKFKIYPPDINRSHIEFDVPEEKAVGFGLAAIKGLVAKLLNHLLLKEKKTANTYHLQIWLNELILRVSVKRY